MANEQYANGNNEQYGAVAAGGDGVPAGVILMWSGAVASIPSGYAFCNGQNGTPDLRNRFIVCAQQDSSGVAKANPDGGGLVQSGGSVWHGHEFITDGHTHQLDIEGTAADGGDIMVPYDYTNIDYDSGETDPVSLVPPFFALAYIMKL